MPWLFHSRRCYTVSYMDYKMTATAVTLNDLEGHSQVAGLFKCNHGTQIGAV